MEDSITAFIKRMEDLSHRSYEHGYNTFSDFLNQDEISILLSHSFEINYRLYGGYDGAERCIAGFGNNIDNSKFEIDCIKAEPLNQKFADSLTHRDFLGAFMNLGINRNAIGDILVKENIGYVFCRRSIVKFITDNLERIKHTSVKCTVIGNAPEFLMKEPEPQEIITASARVDVIVAAVFGLSRNTVTRLVNQQRVFINSRTAYKESLTLKPGDTVSVRGYGKFIFKGTVRTTKKGRNVTEVGVYQ